MGPSRLGAEDGWSAPSSIDSMEDAPAKPTPSPKAPVPMRAASSNERRARLDIYLQYSRISEESVKCWAAVLAFPLLLAAAPVALVTGAVRDQYGDPIRGALVSAQGGQAATDADGTFALEVSDAAQHVTITCTYCKRTVATIAADGTVVAIVIRYAALTSRAPSARDLQALPYAHAESDAALRPFTLFNDSSRILPGPRVSTYGASAFGGLVIDDGIPQYDIAAGTSSWRAFPDFVAQDIAITDQTNAFRYGDMAGGGTFAVDTQTQSGLSALLLGGNEGALRVTQALSDAAYTAAASTDQDETRLRADGSVRVPIGDSSFAATAILAQDRGFPEDGGSINDSAGGLVLHFQGNRPQPFFANAILDREGYSTLTAGGSPVDGLWSDVMTQAGIASNTPVQLFATISGRWSTGYYDASAAGIPRVSGAVTQAQAVLGMQRTGENFSFQGGVGVFNVSYAGGTLGIAQPLSATILSPSLSGSYAFDSHWTASVSGSGAFRLPSLLEAYASALPFNELPYDRYNSLLESVDYTDDKRVRVSLLAMNESVTNLDQGMVHTAGAQITWQIAPVLSLRAWEMHVNDTTKTEYPLFRFARTPIPSTVGSIWLTYDLPGGIRADAIYRRDLIDYSPDQHLDASISGPLSHGLRWFALTERRHGERYAGAGLQFGLP